MIFLCVFCVMLMMMGKKKPKTMLKMQKVLKEEGN